MDGSFHTMMTDSKEDQDVMTADVLNSFAQTGLNKETGEEKVVVKITGVPVDTPVEDGPDMCAAHVAHGNGKKVLCVEWSKAIHGMLMSASLFHMEFKFK